MNEFLDAINTKFEASDLTMVELANRAGCGRQYLYRVFAGQQVPSIEKASAIAKALGLDLRVVPSRRRRSA